MLNTYCARCGAVNQIGEHLCVGCGVNLADQPTYAAATERSEWTTDEPSSWTAAQPSEWEPYRNPAAPLPGIGSFSVGHVLGVTLRLFTKRLWLITKIVFLVVAPFEVFKLLSLTQARPDWQTISVAWLLGAICNILIAPALIYALMKVLETGVAPGVNESFRWGLTKVGRLAVCAAISFVLQALGYMLLVIPGIIVGLALALVYPVAVLEKGSPSDVLSRSRQLTRGYRWEILGAEMLLGLLALVVIGPVSFLFSMISPEAPKGLLVIAAIVQDIVEQTGTVLSLVMYLTLVRTWRQQNSILSLTN